jgi:RimJ/RimL family protein N-acetyltransferase
VLPVPDPPLTDGVVTLRLPDEQDLSAIEQGVRDPDVVQWFGRQDLTAHEVLELNRARWSEGSGATFAVCDPQSDCVGHVWVNLSDPSRGSVGYWLLPRARGWGLATRSVRLLSRWALRELGLVRLQVLTEPGNLASQRVAERCGYGREGVLRSYARIDDRLVDYLVFSLLPGDLSNMEAR